MFLVESEARKKWCPLVRVDDNNRFNNRFTGGFDDPNNPYHCLGSECMMWREVHPMHLKSGAVKALAAHGYCGIGGRPDLDLGD